MTNSRIHIFVSYSHMDRQWFKKLQPLLKFSEPTCLANVWHDQELKAGDRWEDEIRSELRKMDIFLALISYHFLYSEFITNTELPEAISREKKGETVIVPLLVCDMLDKDIEHLKPFNPLPAWNRSWRWYERRGGHTIDAHKPIRSGLLQAVEKAKAVKSTAVIV